jgi:PIN domain nuclease of toxin-antitoxin system
MKLLLDTHLLLCAANEPGRLPKAACALLEDQENELLFSAASLWEVTNKSALGRADFQADARLLRRALLDNGYEELPVTSEHAVNFPRGTRTRSTACLWRKRQLRELRCSPMTGT